VLIRRSPTQVAGPLLVLLVLAGCAEAPVASAPETAASSAAASSTPGPTETPVSAEALTEVAELIALGGRAKPYSAQMNVRSLVDGQLGAVMSGRMNFNTPDETPMTGRLTVRTTALDSGEPPMAVEEVFSKTGSFVRTMANGTAPPGLWKRVPTPAGGGKPMADGADYARALLLAGPSAVKGQEKQGGVLATRLSGQIKTEQVRTIEAGLYGRLREANVDDFACDIWIDPAGRIVRLEQWIRMQGRSAHNVMTMSTFRGPVTVKAPTD